MGSAETWQQQVFGRKMRPDETKAKVGKTRLLTSDQQITAASTLQGRVDATVTWLCILKWKTM